MPITFIAPFLPVAAANCTDEKGRASSVGGRTTARSETDVPSGGQTDLDGDNGFFVVPMKQNRPGKRPIRGERDAVGAGQGPGHRPNFRRGRKRRTRGEQEPYKSYTRAGREGNAGATPGQHARTSLACG